MGNGREGLGKSGPRRREAVAREPFHQETSGLAAGGLGPVLAGTQESKQFIPFSESHFSHLCNNRNQATMDEIIGFKQFPFSHGILYSNGVLQRINQNLYEE